MIMQRIKPSKEPHSHSETITLSLLKMPPQPFATLMLTNNHNSLKNLISLVLNMKMVACLDVNVCYESHATP